MGAQGTTSTSKFDRSKSDLIEGSSILRPNAAATVYGGRRGVPVKKLLNPNEEVVIDLNPHWSTLVKPVALLVVVLVATIVGYSVNNYLGYALAVVLLVAAGWVAIKVAHRQTTEFVVTTNRIVYRSGTCSPSTGKVEIPLGHINDISFKQSVFERMIGTGDLSIESAGAQSRETFSDIAQPSRVQNEILPADAGG